MKRPYDSTLRRARTEQIKARILDAGKKLFAQHGIDRVTIEELASEADVSVATVYALFKSKAGILTAVIHKTFFGDRYTALMDRLNATADPIALLKLTASISRLIYDSEKAEIGLIRGASAFSPELKRVEQEFEQIRYERQLGRAELLVQTFPKARELGLAKVRDIIWMLTGRDVYGKFVIDRGWSSDAYEEWVADTLIQTLT